MMGTVVMGRGSFSDFDIQALVDKELPPEQETMLREYLKHNESAKRRYQELCEQKERLQNWWRRLGALQQEQYREGCFDTVS